MLPASLQLNANIDLNKIIDEIVELIKKEIHKKANLFIEIFEGISYLSDEYKDNILSTIKNQKWKPKNRTLKNKIKLNKIELEEANSMLKSFRDGLHIIKLFISTENDSSFKNGTDLARNISKYLLKENNFFKKIKIEKQFNEIKEDLKSIKEYFDSDFILNAKYKKIADSGKAFEFFEQLQKNLYKTINEYFIKESINSFDLKKITNYFILYLFYRCWILWK